MLSRVANSVYWMNRYIERAENVARFIEVNLNLSSKLETLHDDPYGAGWIAKIRVSDESGLGKLLDHKAYEKQCAEEGH